jgi:hypothetical protein
MSAVHMKKVTDVETMRKFSLVLQACPSGGDLDIGRGHTWPWRISWIDQRKAARTMRPMPPEPWFCGDRALDVSLLTNNRMAPTNAVPDAVQDTLSECVMAISRLSMGVTTMKLCKKNAPVVADVLENPYRVVMFAANPQKPSSAPAQYTCKRFKPPCQREGRQMAFPIH